MSGGSWKVAYADFMTAMFAFFLLMWILNATTDEAKKVISGYFAQGGTLYDSGIKSSVANNPLVQYVDRAKMRDFKMSEVEKNNYAVAEDIKRFIMTDPKLSRLSGVTSDGIGVLLHVESDLMFKPNSADFADGGYQILDDVAAIMLKYKTFLVVRGHADSSETGAPNYANKWELSSARANAAIRYLISKNINPALMRSISYADTRPKVLATDPDAQKINSRVEFNFHRPEVMSTIVGY